MGSGSKPPHKAKSTHKGRKYGRNRVKCARYRAEGRRERNKARKSNKL